MVVSTRNAGVRAIIIATTSATAATTCSQLSRISNVGVLPICSTIRTARSDRCAADPSSRRLATESRTPRADPISAATPSGEVDAGQLDEVHHRLLGEPAHHVGEPGLAEPAGAHDRGDPRRPDRLRQGGHVVVAADQAAGVVQEPLANRAVLRQQLGVELLQRGTGVGAEPVADLLAVPLVAVERGRGAALGGLAAQQGREQRLVVGIAGQRGLEQGERLGVTTRGRTGRARGSSRPRRRGARASRRTSSRGPSSAPAPTVVPTTAAASSRARARSPAARRRARPRRARAGDRASTASSVTPRR